MNIRIKTALFLILFLTALSAALATLCVHTAILALDCVTFALIIGFGIYCIKLEQGGGRHGTC